MLTGQWTSIGRIVLQTHCGILRHLYLPHEAPAAPPPLPNSPESHFFAQISEFLSGKRNHFTIPTQLPAYSPIRLSILEKVAAIPYGATATYGSLGPARVVGNVCANNPLPLIIPCHRVIPAHNYPGQYRGGVQLKRVLLQLEQGLLSVTDKKELPEAQQSATMRSV